MNNIQITIWEVILILGFCSFGAFLGYTLDTICSTWSNRKNDNNNHNNHNNE